MDYSKLLTILSLIFNAIATIVLIFPYLNIKNNLNDDCITSVDKDEKYTQKKHLKERRVNMWGLTFLAIGFILQLFAVLLSGNHFYTNEKFSEATEESFLNDKITPLYFFSYGVGSDIVKCVEAKNIDWDIAIVALSDYMEYGAGSTSGEEHGTAEIQRNFEENCKRNMAIYTDVVTKNPELLQGNK